MTARKAAGAALKITGLALAGLTVLSAAVVTAPRLFGLEPYSVLSGSMEPEIPTGSLVYIEEAEPESVAEGDVIAFYDDLDNVVVHRVVRNRLVEGEFVTKGDANAEPDMNPVDYFNFNGLLAYCVPGMGRLAVLYSGMAGRVGALCVVLLGAMASTFGSRLCRDESDEDD